jgi:hypothetical protein
MQAIKFKQGIHKFGDKGIQVATDELKQLHEKQVFKPINMDDLTNTGKQSNGKFNIPSGKERPKD